MRTKRLTPDDTGYRHPYGEYESSPLWPLLDKGIRALVENKNLIERTDRSYIVGYLCKVVLSGQKGAKRKTTLAK